MINHVLGGLERPKGILRCHGDGKCRKQLASIGLAEQVKGVELLKLGSLEERPLGGETQVSEEGTLLVLVLF